MTTATFADLAVRWSEEGVGREGHDETLRTGASGDFAHGALRDRRSGGHSETPMLVPMSDPVPLMTGVSWHMDLYYAALAPHREGWDIPDLNPSVDPLNEPGPTPRLVDRLRTMLRRMEHLAAELHIAMPEPVLRPSPESGVEAVWVDPARRRMLVAAIEDALPGADALWLRVSTKQGSAHWHSPTDAEIGMLFAWFQAERDIKALFEA